MLIVLSCCSHSGQRQLRGRSWSLTLWNQSGPELKIAINSNKRIEEPGDALRECQADNRAGEGMVLERAFRVCGVLLASPRLS